MTNPMLATLPGATARLPLGDTEKAIAWRLAQLMYNRQGDYGLCDQYRTGTQEIPSLGISVPPELEPMLEAIVGWGGDAIDAVSDRLSLQGFILNDDSEVDDELLETFQANNVDGEAPMVHDDSMNYGHGLVVIGVDVDDSPVITGESPRNMAVHTDRASGIVTCAYQTYTDDDPQSETYGSPRSVLYLPAKTTHLTIGQDGKWEVIRVDDHPETAKYGCPVVVFPNRPSTGNRLGAPEIAPAWRSCMNRAARALIGTEVMREFHILRKLIILGASEKAFQDADGNMKTVWESYADIMPAIEADEEGNVPEIKEIQGASPDGLLKLVDAEARLMSGYTGLNPQAMGIINTGNPVSGDSIRMADHRLSARTARKATAYGNDWVRVARWTYLVRGEDRAELQRAEADWGPTGIPTPNADADALSKEAAAGQVPPRSDTALARLGYSAIERRNMKKEFREADGRELVAAVTGRLSQTAQTPGSRLQDVAETAASNQERLDAIASST